MATGNALLTLSPLAYSPPATLAAPIDFIVGTSTPVEWFPVLSFDASTNWYADWHGLVMPAHYAGGGITMSLRFLSTVATNNVIWGAAFRLIADDAEDLDTTAHTYDYNAVTSAVASAIGEEKYATITFTNGADMDSVVVGSSFSLRIRRDAANGSDNSTGFAQLARVYLTET